MDWIRRNWPDLLIGIALLAVIAGIIATLLSGGSFLPFARNNTPVIQTPSTPTTTSSSLPNTNSNPVTEAIQNTGAAASDAANSAVNAGANVVDSAAQGLANATDATTDAVANAGAAVNNVATDAVNAAGDAVESVIPVLPSIGDATQNTVQNAATGDSATVEASTANGTDTSSNAVTTAVANVAASNSAAAPYRVSVGAFGSSENANRRAETFRDAGYPVFLGSQGSLSLVLVGPYDTEFEAQQVQSQIRSSGLEPNATIYRYDPSTSETPATSVTASTTSTPAASAATEPTTTAAASTTASETPAATPVTTAVASTQNFVAPPTANSGRYLQVGAYTSMEDSMPQRRTLEGFGYRVVHIEEQGFIKLLVGPFDASNLNVAQSQLVAQGIESFVR